MNQYFQIKTFIVGIGVLFIVLMTSCAKINNVGVSEKSKDLLITNINDGKNDSFLNIQTLFSKNNPGFKLDFIVNKQIIEKNNENRIVFIQEGGGTIDLNGHASSKFSIGDIIALRPADQIYADSLFSALIISSPDEIPKDIPSFIRPDWDPNITDVPGGCATETNAYRRILLTWKESVGKYVYHSVNAHRVRIMNSFSHYHPIRGGFDEFYLVQMAAPTAKILISHNVDQIENNESLSEKTAEHLIQSYSLNVGDLIYLPRGVMHRGVGNALVQVITVPGFVPGAEIGVDHHLFSLHNRFKNLEVPFNKEASNKAVIK